MHSVVVFQGKDDQFYWHRIAENEEVISHGEGYTREDDAMDGAKNANPDLPSEAFSIEGNGLNR